LQSAERIGRPAGSLLRSPLDGTIVGQLARLHMSSTPEDLMNLAVSARNLEDIAALSPGTVSVRVACLDDARARALTRLGGLQCVLGDGNSVISDDGLGLLCELKNLRVLDLEWCATISDKGLVKLGDLKQLLWLDLSFCRRITIRGVDELQALLPECKIELASS
jgi:hypothetical protein